MKMSKKRQAIWDKSGGKCWYCGCDLPEKGWHADHFEPVRRDLKLVFDSKNNCHKLTSDKTMMHKDRDTEENKVPSCASCNIIKSSQTLEGFRATISGFIKSLNRDSTQYKFSKRYGLIKESKIEVKFWFEENLKDD